MSLTPGTELHWSVTKYGHLMDTYEMKAPRGEPLTLKVYYYDSEYYVELWVHGVLLCFANLFR